MNNLIFWLDTFKGDKAKGGYYYRSDIKDFVKRLEDSGEKVVGISLDMESYNLDFIVEDTEGEVINVDFNN